MKTKQYEMIICIVNPDNAETIIKTARQNGMLNATFIKSRSTGDFTTESFLGVEVQPEKDVILMVVEKENRRKVMEEVALVAGFNTQANGICFSMPIEHWSGMNIKKAQITDVKIEKAKVATASVRSTDIPIQSKTEN